MKRLFLIFVAAVCVLFALGVSGVMLAMQWYRGAGPLDEPVTLVIEPGTGFNRIAQQLEGAGVIDDALLFRAVVMAHGAQRDFRAGEYAFDAGMSPASVVALITSGKSLRHAITIPEGKTSAEITALLLADERLSGLVPPDLPEGSLLPDTHYVHRGDTRASVIDRMRVAQRDMLAALWARRAPGLPLASPREALILASIVEKETGLDGERGNVASVFINRLRRGMKLQSDPTVVYAIESESGPMQRPLLRRDWAFEHPYNTYVIDALPPGPICHPGRAALEAVLNPPDTDYLYFVATGKGGHYFARTLGEHNRNVARYQQTRREREAAGE